MWPCLHMPEQFFLNFSDRPIEVFEDFYIYAAEIDCDLHQLLNKLHFHQDCEFAVETLAITLKRHQATALTGTFQLALAISGFQGR